MAATPSLRFGIRANLVQLPCWWWSTPLWAAWSG